MYFFAAALDPRRLLGRSFAFLAYGSMALHCWPRWPVHGVFIPWTVSRSIYSQLEVQFPAQLVYFSAGILLLYISITETPFSKLFLPYGMLCFFSTICYGRHPRRFMDIGDSLRLRVLALFCGIRAMANIIPTRWRTWFRGHGERHSDMMSNVIPK